ncbi:hypothetical protein [Nocardioides sp. Root140]|uniref:hypothetical protein n=1 Tax=Nocardioides sp. Root140 TaxID=1736460 RepID=UPI0012E3E227|nr:hypothetical protein [Nocardioides sp. Root140]
MNSLTLLGTRLTVVGALLGVVACTGDEPACACGDPGRPVVTAGQGVGAGHTTYAVVHGGRTAYVVDRESTVVDEVTLPEHAVIRQAVPGTVSFFGDDTIWNLDLSEGSVDTIHGLDGDPSRLEDGQRLAVRTETQGDASDGSAASDEPGPEELVSVQDVLTGDTETVDTPVGGPAEVVARTGDLMVLERHEDGALVALRLDKPIATPVELPTDDLEEISFSADGHTAATSVEGSLRLGDTSAELDGVGREQGTVLGVVGRSALVDRGTGLVLVGRDGRESPVRGAVDGLELQDPSGLLRRGDDEAPGWYRLSGTRLTEMRAVRGMQLELADSAGWWFSTAGRTAPLSRFPLVAVAPGTGVARPVGGDLAQLAALADGVEHLDGRYRAAPFRNDNGFTDLALADARTGVVVSVDDEQNPITIAPEGSLIASTTVQGPTITTFTGGSQRVVPVFDIDEDSETWDYHWVRG